MNSSIKFLVLILVFCSLSNLIGQTNRIANPCPKGLYPNGKNCYPCLGCHPCSSNPKDGYCDDLNRAAVSVNVLEPSKLIADYKACKLKNLISENDLKRLVTENSFKIDGQERYTKVKCKCGTNVYGKDAAACIRICDFLGDSSKDY